MSFTGINVTAQSEKEFIQYKESPQNGRTDQDPVALFGRGQDAHSKGDLKVALDFYNRALKAKPEFPEAEYQRGVIYNSLGNKQKAENSFRRAIEIEKNWHLPYIEIGRILLARGDFPNAQKFLVEAIRLDEKSYEAYSEITDLYVKKKASDNEFKSLLKKVSALSMSDEVPLTLWVSKAIVERRLGDLDSAGKSIAKALAIEKQNIFALIELTEIYLASGSDKKAINTAKHINTLYPESQNGKKLLARAYYLNGNLSTKSLEGILEKDANNISVLARLCSLTRVTAPRKALSYCNRALAIEKSNINHAIGYGAALIQLKRYPDAVSVLSKLLKYAPQNYTIHANLATALFQMEDFEAAKKEYLWIIRKKPGIAIAFYFLAICQDRLRNYQDAMINYRKFLALANPNKNKLEIEKVNLRVSKLEHKIKQSRGKKENRSK